ncbi:MAG: ankyrin repeat domain-containing protein [Proteobacteria bacterium]|nr:ankyrin repeat domain-containing protein [Pseudomonadota bacterium]
MSALDAALFAAIARRDGDEALALIGRGADVNATEHYEVAIDRERVPGTRTPLMAALAAGDMALAKRLLAVPGIDVNAQDELDGRTALICAVRAGDLALVDAMLKQGASAAAQAGGKTALAHAIEAGHAGVACRLIEAGLDPNDNLAGPLVDAAFRGQREVVLRLLAAGVDIDATDETGNTPLVGAAWGGRDAMLVELLDRGADLALSGAAALAIAANAGHATTIRLLAGRGVALDGRNAFGWTPLISAAWQGNDEAVACLLELGADPRVTDDARKTALDWAREGGRQGVIALLSRGRV